MSVDDAVVGRVGRDHPGDDVRVVTADRVLPWAPRGFRGSGGPLLGAVRRRGPSVVRLAPSRQVDRRPLEAARGPARRRRQHPRAREQSETQVSPGPGPVWQDTDLCVGRLRSTRHRQLDVPSSRPSGSWSCRHRLPAASELHGYAIRPWSGLVTGESGSAERWVGNPYPAGAAAPHLRTPGPTTPEPGSQATLVGRVCAFTSRRMSAMTSTSLGKITSTWPWSV